MTVTVAVLLLAPAGSSIIYVKVIVPLNPGSGVMVMVVGSEIVIVPCPAITNVVWDPPVEGSRSVILSESPSESESLSRTSKVAATLARIVKVSSLATGALLTVVCVCV